MQAISWIPDASFTIIKLEGTAMGSPIEVSHYCQLVLRRPGMQDGPKYNTTPSIKLSENEGMFESDTLTISQDSESQRYLPGPS